MSTPVQLDWLADAAFARVTTHPPKPRARHSDVETSHAAAEKAARIVGDHEGRILDAITKAGARGRCSKEIARDTGLTHVQVDRRLAGMGERKLIERRHENGVLVKREGCACWVRA